MGLIPPFFLNCVVAIGRRGPDKPEWNASGFLYGEFVAEDGDQKRYAIYLVTNRHVFDGTNEAILRFNPSGTDPAREYDIALVDQDGKPKWLAHPDAEIDVAVVPISGTKLRADGVEFEWFRSDQHVLLRDAAIETGAAEGDDVFVLGFPMGLVGGDRNYVIVRQGAVARIRDWLAGTAKDFLVDSSIFPGNSGGPVVSRPELTSIEGTKAPNAAYLLGVIKSYLPYRDVAVSQQTKMPRIIFEENSGLASVVPIDYVSEVVRAHIATRPVPPPTEQESAPPEESRPGKNPRTSRAKGGRAQKPKPHPSPKRLVASASRIKGSN